MKEALDDVYIDWLGQNFHENTAENILIRTIGGGYC